jgi:MYXO-CTERM domain-containing protein
VCGLRCDGTDAKACHYAASSAACGLASCGSGVENDISTCDGSGACKVATRSCGAYACGPTACLSACAKDDDCATGNFCKAGACVGVQNLGEACTGPSQCASGFCTDGVCCGVATCGTGAACAGPGTQAGQCLKGAGSTCGASAECASSHCVDGLCCDKACDGQCEACDIKGSEGTCTPVTGKPHGARPVCDALSDTDCAKTTCDGTARDKCSGFGNGATTSCGADTCTADKKSVQKHGQCDGKGGCAKPDPVPCLEFMCDGTANACSTSCKSDADCASSYKCDAASSKCVQGSTCSADKTSSVDKTGTTQLCAPYLCGADGTCNKQCATSDDCVGGSSCDTNVHACVVAGQDNGAGSTDSGGGCSTSSSGGSSSGVGAAFALLAGLGVIARRRRSA